MGFLAKLFKPKADTIGNVVGSVGTLAKDLRTAITGEISAEKKAEIELKTQEIEAQVLKAQTAINIEEAKSSKLFVAGWRPFIGWICGLALLFSFIIKPLTDMILVAVGSNVVMPDIDINALYPIILGMLGLAVTRTYEKKNNVQGNH